MTCREYYDFLMAYLDGELAEDERVSFESHIADCPPCQSYLETYRATVRMERELCGSGEGVPADAPDDLVAAILAARRHPDGPATG